MPTLFAAAGGTAFRFALPTLALPAPGGERCRVEVTFVADSHAHLLATDGPLCQSQLGPHELFDDLSITRLVVGNTLWLLSGLQKTSKTEPIKISAKAERWQLGPGEGAGRLRELSSSPASQVPSNGRIAAQHLRRWEWNDPAAYAERSSRPPAQGYGPLTSRTSNDPDIVADFPVPNGLASPWVKEDHEDLTIEHELSINVALPSPINFMRYVDYLPPCDTFAPNAKIIDRRLAPNSLWSVRQDMQTYFKATRLDPGLRVRTWQLLTTPGMGLPCVVDSGMDVHFNLAGMEGCGVFADPWVALDEGKALMKLIPVGDDYACQPRSAWPEASYLFNNWRVVVEQDGKQVDLFSAHGQYLEARDQLWKDGPIIDQLAEMASAERGPGRIVYAKVPYRSGEELSGIGVRLRDGGSRFSFTSWRTVPSFALPGSKYIHSKWGRFDGVQHERQPDTCSPCSAEAKLKIANPEGKHDIILRVNESEIGDYNRLEYALRPRKSFKPIMSNEWLPVTTDVLDQWVICFFINLAKVTWGCFNRDLVRPSTASATVSPALSTSEPAAGLSLSTASSSTSSSVTSSRETKKPRIS